jgi:hypothetical protein
MARRPAYPNHVGTIGGTIRMGHGLWVHCENRECLHRAHIDFEAIAERYGAELSVAEFVNRSVCRRAARAGPTSRSRWSRAARAVRRWAKPETFALSEPYRF